MTIIRPGTTNWQKCNHNSAGKTSPKPKTGSDPSEALPPLTPFLILTVSETCRLQHRNAYEYLIEAMKAKLNHRAAPTLLPNLPDVTASAA